LETLNDRIVVAACGLLLNQQRDAVADGNAMVLHRLAQAYVTYATSK
jgi:hypothetical protein